MSRPRVAVDLVPDPERLRRTAPAGAPARAAGPAGVAIDVLRATSTLTVARANGAAVVVPFATPEGALAYRDAHPGALACGERGGRIVPGFDLGNSPSEFPRDRVAGRTLAFASTNGSLAMLAVAHRPVRWLAAFVNAAAVTRALVAGGRDVAITCAGKEGAFALEDAACAGWLVARLAEAGFEPGNAAARLCASLAPRDALGVRALVEGCEHARVLRELGPAYAADVGFCAALDALDAAHGF
jgi:2-phosphosulfolactate phosphatase